jgi:zinc/manganese transport system permease protein
MTLLYDWLLAPFADYGFLRRALVACLALSFGGSPVGVFLVLRRMSLIGDTLAHAVLPGAAAGFLLAGLSLPAMSFGGFLAGLAVALAAGLVSRITPQREDASFAAFFTISLAAGVLLVSLKGSAVDLMHVLFGSILAVDDAALILMAGVSSLSLFAFALLYRGLVAECFDPLFLRAARAHGGWFHSAFLVLAVANLVSGFQTLGTLMAVGLMMLSATAARFWAAEIWSLILTAMAISFASGYAGLLLSFHGDLPSGPTIVLAAGVTYLFSMVAGPRQGLLWKAIRRPHLQQ